MSQRARDLINHQMPGYLEREAKRQELADAHAAPIDLDASLSDAALASSAARQDVQTGEGLVLSGAELAAYLRFRDAAMLAKRAQVGMTEASSAMREAIAELARAVPVFDEAEWKK
jgi:hypothetical protein